MSCSELDSWRQAVGEKEADRIAGKAAKRGTTLHNNIEKYLNNENVAINTVEMLDLDLFKRTIPVIQRIGDIKLIEAPLYSKYIHLAGTVDCIANFDNIASIIDFKTSIRIKDKSDIDKYFLQTALYSLFFEELYGEKISQLVILIFNEYSVPSIFIDDRKNWLPKLKNLLKIHKV